MKTHPLSRPLTLARAACLWTAMLLGAIPVGAETAAPSTYPDSLPPEPLARAAIAASPMTELARLSWQAEKAQSRILRAGTHEWTVKAALQRRLERTGNSFTEREFGLERGLRWGDKAQLDGRIAEAGIAASISAYEDAWHEAARTLLKAWFELAREESSLQSLASQVALTQEQLAVVQKRVAAGDAPRLDALLAQGEWDRTQASLSANTQRAQALRIELERRYPSLQKLSMPKQDLRPSGPQPTTLDAGQLEQAIVADNHEIELAKAYSELARLRLARTERDKRGDPTVGLRFAQERGGQENIVGISLAIPFGTVVRDARAQVAAIEASKAEVREREVQTRVGYEAVQAARAVEQSRRIAEQLAAAAQQAANAARLAAIAYAEGEMQLVSLLQSRRQAGEAQMAATLAWVTAQEAHTRALLDAHQLWTPTPLDENAHP